MYNAKILQPIFVTNEEQVEFEKIENKTKAYISGNKYVICFSKQRLCANKKKRN